MAFDPFFWNLETKLVLGHPSLVNKGARKVERWRQSWHNINMGEFMHLLAHIEAPSPWSKTNILLGPVGGGHGTLAGRLLTTCTTRKSIFFSVINGIWNSPTVRGPAGRPMIKRFSGRAEMVG